MNRAPAAALLVVCCAAHACASTGGPGARSQPVATVAMERVAALPAVPVRPWTPPPPVRRPPPGPPALFLVDGRRATRDELSRLEPGRIAEVHIVKAPDSVRRFGADAAGGAVLITTRPPRPR